MFRIFSGQHMTLMISFWSRLWQISSLAQPPLEASGHVASVSVPLRQEASIRPKMTVLPTQGNTLHATTMLMDPVVSVSYATILLLPAKLHSCLCDCPS